MPKVIKKTTKKANPLLDENQLEAGVEQEFSPETEEILETPVKKEEPIVKVVAKENAINSDKTVQKALASDISSTKDALAKEEKAFFMIPLAEGEKEGTIQEVWINGFKMDIPKGVMAQLPMSVVNILAEKYKVNATAGQQFRLDLDPTKLENLN